MKYISVFGCFYSSCIVGVTNIEDNSMASGHFIFNYFLAVAYRTLDFGSHFILKCPDDCFWGFCGPQLRGLPQDGSSVSGRG